MSLLQNHVGSEICVSKQLALYLVGSDKYQLFKRFHHFPKMRRGYFAKEVLVAPLLELKCLKGRITSSVPVPFKN